MGTATDSAQPSRVAQALVDFTVNGAFPDESVVSLVVAPEDLPAGIEALKGAKAKLEAEIHEINEETADDVKTWQANAQSVQDDILRSKALANDITRQAEAPDVSGKAIADTEAKAEFIVRELNYNQQVQEALRGIRDVNRILDQVEQARNERRVLDALHLLEKSWTALDSIPVSKSVRALKLLDIRAFELKESVRQAFDHVWDTLVHVDVANGTFSVSGSISDEPMNLSDAVIGLKAFKQVDQRAKQLWHDLDQAIVAPRMDTLRNELPRVQTHDDLLKRTGSADNSVKTLFMDLELIFSFLVQKLPADLVGTITPLMMLAISSRIKNVWLDSAVPSSLTNMGEFQEVIETTRHFCSAVATMGLSGLDDLQEWVESAPRVWLSKCREAALDSVRIQLSQGLGTPKQVERVEKQQVSRAEGKELAANGAVSSTDDQGWDASWSDEEESAKQAEKSVPEAAEVAADEDDGADAWGWGDNDDTTEEAPQETFKEPKSEEADDEDPSDAWGWGDDAGNEQPEAASAGRQTVNPSVAPETRELTLKEAYHISSMPEPVLALVSAILEDGAALTQGGFANSPVATAAPGLFSLPTLALAMFRAISPYYYSLDIGGNMYLYNDATYLAESLSDFSASWKNRTDLGTRAQNMLRLDNDIKSLEAFAKRAYSNEMSIQKTVLRDLLGGEQNLMHQDDKKAIVEAAVSRVQTMAITWESILSRSTWYQVVGSLANAVASKIIADVMEMAGISQDEAYAIADLIAVVTELDALFLPSRSAGTPAHGEVPTTAHYAASWLRLQYLSEVLQSNLNDVRFLWMESELSLYFSVDEVVELVRLSFEDNPRTQKVLREITNHPTPRGQEEA